MKISGLLFLFPVVLACTAASARPSYHIIVRVESDPGVPLSAAGLRADGRPLASSDEHGTITTDLLGQAGDTITLTVACPAGYRTPGEPLMVLLSPDFELARRREFRVRCPPLTRKLVVAVRATNGPNLPVRYLGHEIARTDATGAAHALLSAVPGDALTLTLDTSAPENAQMMPQHPELTVNVPERDELVVFDQSFTRSQAKAKPRQRPPSEEPDGRVHI
jgi:hypothetical protein